MEEIRKKLKPLFKAKDRQEFEIKLQDIFSDLEDYLKLDCRDIDLVYQILDYKKSYDAWGIDDIVENMLWGPLKQHSKKPMA